MKTIVCLGDSITYGYDNNSKMKNFTQVDTPYPKALNQLLGPNYKVINSGNTGWQARQVVNHLESLVFKYKPDIVILMLGINDARGSRMGLPVSQNRYYNNMKEIITRLEDADIKVYLLTPTPVFNLRVKSFNRVAETIAHDMNLEYINMHKAIHHQLKEDNLKLKDVLKDRVHLSQDYYIKLAEIVYKNLYL
ncbi:SGNH/GDSL hydrolase family protein [Mollicutes bacterium LVI A0078]|nr:SGNH/GDSL hydrolase family protein [Mollicutes bacterium LVI A0075]WOO90324.1 SGNH/GDSL hydrolase family protein [Mollicutes bacterium LVI A0078]